MRRRASGSSCRSSSLEAVCRDAAARRLDGFGLAVQAYQKRGTAVIDWLASLAAETRRRLNVRLVKGAYWDSEIKRAQERGLPVLSGLHAQDQHRRGLSALAGATCCAPARDHTRSSRRTTRTRSPTSGSSARQLNGSSSSSACTAWERNSTRRSSARDGLDRPCRVYAPVGEHEDLLPYLVRRSARERLQHFVRESHSSTKTSRSTAIVGGPGAMRSMLSERAAHPRIPLAAATSTRPERVNSLGVHLAEAPRCAALAARMERVSRARMGRSAAGRRAGAYGR